MVIEKIHPDEIDINISIIQDLLSEQFPEWANLQLELFSLQGTDNVMVKFGEGKIIRLPRSQIASDTIRKECVWVPRLSNQLPLTIPTIIRKGIPSERYPYHWSITDYLDGENPSKINTLDLNQAAQDLAQFVISLQEVDTKSAPLCSRGVPLKNRDKETRDALKLLASEFDTSLLEGLWTKAIEIPVWNQSPVWIHGDLHSGNLLCVDNKLTAVIDFGMAGVGDPACDLMVAWTLLDKNSREVFRKVVQPDETTWARGQGWALHFGIVAYAYYKTKDSSIAPIARETLIQILKSVEKSP